MLHRLLLGALSLLLVLSILAPTDAPAQCILTNPSFEIGGQGGYVFGGWEQSGIIGSTSEATHGSTAARVTGPNWGDWEISAFWQRQDCAVGEQWEVTAMVAHSPTSPLTGGSRAIVNIEWRNSSNDIISYESYDAATAATPAGEYIEFAQLSPPAPSGTVAAHVLFAVLQDPSQPQAEVYYDQTTFYSQSYPTIDDMQWNDFPGGTTLDFSGRTWRVKGPGYYGPGPNSFTNSPNHVWVDEDQLHLTVKNIGGTWYSTEVALVEPLGYGDYIFTTVGRLDLLDPDVVFGLFTWQYGPCWDDSYLWWGPYNEFDIEFSRWGNPSSDIGQFVAQPWDWSGNVSRFDATFSEGEITSHAIRWLNDRVECRSWRGGPNDEALGDMIHEWTYTGPHVPRPEQPRVHINLWQIGGVTPGSIQEVVLDEFTFFPADPTGVDYPQDQDHSNKKVVRLRAATPNPFNPVTTIGYSLKDGGHAEMVIFDIAGRRVRTLVSGAVPAGDHEATWDGLDDRGKPVASGVYFYRLSARDSLETKRMVLVK